MINLSTATPAPASAGGRCAQANATQQDAGLLGATQVDASSFHEALVQMLGNSRGKSFSATGETAAAGLKADSSRKTGTDTDPALDASALPPGLPLPLPPGLDASALPPGLTSALPPGLASALAPSSARQSGLGAVVADSKADLGRKTGADTALALDASALPDGLAPPTLTPKIAPVNVLSAVHAEALKDVLATPVLDTASSRTEPPAMSLIAAQASTIGSSTSTPGVPEPSATVQVRVGERAWDQAVAEKLVWMVDQKHQVAQLHLNPPELGPLKISISLDQNQASAQFFSAHASVREALEVAMPRLREMLADSGITLGNASVGTEAFREPTQQHPQAHVAQSNALAVDSGTVSSGERLLRPMLGLVDTFA